jgi:ribosomal-protein-serine acetyltransferase
MFVREVAPNLLLRQVSPADAASFFTLVERNREYLREWLPWVDKNNSVDDVRDFIARAQSQWEEGRGPNTGIWLDGALVGAIGCHPIDIPNRNCSIGYWVDSGIQRKGVITRSCAALLDYLFDDVSLHRVEIRCGTGNARSCAIPTRLGFTREGVAWEAEWVMNRWVDLVVWAMLRQNWRGRT